MSLLFDSATSTTTARDSHPADSATTHLDWQLIFDGVWLARRNGRFAGMVQGTSDHPAKLTDAAGNLCGLYKSLDDAKKALEALSR
jgi:hypothetical protein